MSPREQPRTDAMYPMLKRLIRERHQTGRCATWELWTREAMHGIDRLRPNPGPRALLHRQQILMGYKIVGELVEQLIGPPAPKSTNRKP